MFFRLILLEVVLFTIIYILMASLIAQERAKKTLKRAPYIFVGALILQTVFLFILSE